MFDNFLCGTLFALVAAVALVAGAPDHQHAPRLAEQSLSSAPVVVVMPEVQVVGKRSAEFATAPEVIQMPMVVVTGRRDTTNETMAMATDR